MEQRTEEWHTARLGKVTASRIADLTAKTKSGYSTSRQNYMAELICQRLTGVPEPHFESEAMRRGTELEPKARAVYMLETGNIATEVGLVDHPSIPMSAASPDGLIGHDGLIEIKCPNTWTHLQTIKTRAPDRKYLLQMHWQMACTGRKWCDFVSYDDRLPERLAYVCVRIERDEKLIAEISAEVRKFLEELEEEIQDLEQIK